MQLGDDTTVADSLMSGKLHFGGAIVLAPVLIRVRQICCADDFMTHRLAVARGVVAGAFLRAHECAPARPRRSPRRDRRRSFTA
jgi:hypothetical protein